MEQLIEYEQERSFRQEGNEQGKFQAGAVFSRVKKTKKRKRDTIADQNYPSCNSLDPEEYLSGPLILFTDIGSGTEEAADTPPRQHESAQAKTELRETPTLARE